MATAIIFVLIVLIAVFSVKSFIKRIGSGCCGSGDTVKKIKPLDTNRNNYKYKTLVYIHGIHCRNCGARIENAFNKTEGFYAKVNMANKCAEILTKNEPDEGKIKSIIYTLGYTVTDIKKE